MQSILDGKGPTAAICQKDWLKTEIQIQFLLTGREYERCMGDFQEQVWPPIGSRAEPQGHS